MASGRGFRGLHSQRAVGRQPSVLCFLSRALITLMWRAVRGNEKNQASRRDETGQAVWTTRRADAQPLADNLIGLDHFLPPDLNALPTKRITSAAAV